MPLNVPIPPGSSHKKPRQTRHIRLVIKISLIGISVVSSLLFPLGQETDIVRADRLFAGRDNVENLRQAVRLMEDLRGHNPQNYEVLWRLAKYKYSLSDREKREAVRLKLLEAGIEAARKAIELRTGRPEGHFWLAANYGSYAELKGVFKSLRLIKAIREEFETVLGINPAYENGSVYLALGELDLRLPKLFGGNGRRGIELLEAGLKVGPNNSELQLTLAQVYTKIGRKDQAKSLLENVLSLDDPFRTAVEQKELKAKVRHLLDKLK